MSKIKERRGFADYINVATTGGKEEYALMGAGFTELDEKPAAKTSSKRYVNEKSETKRIIGYDWSTSYTLDQIREDKAVDFICNIGEQQLTGADCETSYVRVDLDKPVPENDGSYEARLHKVAVEVAEFSNSDGEMTGSGNLLGVGDVVIGTFDVKAKTFTAKNS